MSHLQRPEAAGRSCITLKISTFTVLHHGVFIDFQIWVYIDSSLSPGGMNYILGLLVVHTVTSTVTTPFASRLKVRPSVRSLSISGLRFPDRVSHKTIYNHDIDPLLPHVVPLSHPRLTWPFVEMRSFGETKNERHVHVSIDSQQVDTGAQLDASLRTPLDPEEFLRIR